jgi:hypothetical protein
MKRILLSKSSQSTRSVITRTLSSSSKSEITRQDLVDEAAALTKSLYRMCFRSSNVMRKGNELDERDFLRRDEEFANPKPGVMSMAPPPDRADELRSRSEYYHSYARECFIQESDCLDNDPLDERDVKRCLYSLRKGHKDRKWLLGDMMFPDPYKNVMGHERIEKFEAMANKYFGKEEKENDSSLETSSPDNSNINSGSDDYFDDADDEIPEWLKKHMK